MREPGEADASVRTDAQQPTSDTASSTSITRFYTVPAPAVPRRLRDNDRVAREPGWQELRAGRWREARAAFEAAAETAESLEGLSWAAWWLDDAETVFEARERAYRSYRQAGNAAGAARMATWLAADELDFHGAGAVAQGWFQRAHRLLDPLEPGPGSRLARFPRGLLPHSAIPRQRSSAERAAELGRRFQVADLEMLGLALQGAALVARSEVDEGMRCLDEATATALAGDAEIPISSAWTCCMLVTACVSVLDYERASAWCDRIAEFAERYGSRYMLGFCRAKYGTVLLWRGRWGEADALLEASAADLGRSRPPSVAGPLTELAELRRRQGRTREALELLERAGASAAAQLCQARLALDAGDAADRGRAARAAAPADARGQGQGSRRSSCSSARRRPTAGSKRQTRLSRELRELERVIGTPPIKASADLAEGVLTAAAGEHERARALLEDAVDAYERCGAPYETAQARLELAATLAALGRRDRAEAETAAATSALRALGRGAGHSRAARDAARTGRARTARGRIDESPDRRTARPERAHRPPARCEHPAQARRPVTGRSGSSCRSRRPLEPAC